ncbi:MAG: hypothetical protein H6709_22355 [Kofleriaceae bacterium]|nr:hypothetical protein [Kofleriaceae bacterium]
MDAAPLPLMLVGDRRVLLIGAGAIGREKLERLLEVGIRPDVIAREVEPRFAELAARHGLDVQRRPVIAGDAAGYDLVLVAVGGARDVARAVHDEVVARHGLVNCADDPELCNVFLSANLRVGGLTVAVSSDGASSALAAHVRDRLRAAVPPWVATALPALAALRARLKALPDPDNTAARRRRFLGRLVRAPRRAWDEDALVAAYRRGDLDAGEVHVVVVPAAGLAALTLGDAATLARADRVLHAADVAAELLALVPPRAHREVVAVGDDGAARAEAAAAAGEIVVRLVAPAADPG